MPLVQRPFPPALPHGQIREVLPDCFFVTGTLRMAAPVRFSRNMTILREGKRLVLVNSVRLDERGLAALDELGEVTDVIRLAGFHGMDDPFYKDRYEAKVWSLKGQKYISGFDLKSEDTYFSADAEIDERSELPLGGSRLHVFHGNPTEGLLLLDRHGGTCVAGDALQNWSAPDEYFSLVGKVMMRFMGFMKPHNVGPGWLKQAKPPKDDLAAVKTLAFANVLPAHGEPVLGGAVDEYGPALDRSIAALSRGG